jgi:DNA-binding MarR family transcriptional regulator/N-acetylglutamate synthase-like GNAT family acetyltransferase
MASTSDHADEAFAARVAAVRRFSRFYTQAIGALGEGYLQSGFSVAQARVLYELAHRMRPSARDLAVDLGLDPGYLSRILRGFERQGLITREPSPEDRRQSILRLTDKGRGAFAPLDARSRQEIGALIAPLRPADQERLVTAMRSIEGLIAPAGAAKLPILLRPHRPGDMGWVVARHGALYAEEYGWDQTFEALVAEIAAQFLRTFDAGHECCWIAERDGVNVGSVFVVRQSDDVAKLRLLIVDPPARGMGLGRRLVEEAIRFARNRRYAKLALWTNDVLDAARHIYQQAGFQLVRSEPHRSFGHELVGETWELAL